MDFNFRSWSSVGTNAHKLSCFSEKIEPDVSFRAYVATIRVPEFGIEFELDFAHQVEVLRETSHVSKSKNTIVGGLSFWIDAIGNAHNGQDELIVVSSFSFPSLAGSTQV